MSLEALRAFGDRKSGIKAGRPPKVPTIEVPQRFCVFRGGKKVICYRSRPIASAISRALGPDFRMKVRG